MDKSKLLIQPKKSNSEHEDIIHQLKVKIGMQNHFPSEITPTGILVAQNGPNCEILKSKSPLPNSSMPNIKSLVRGKPMQHQNNPFPTQLTAKNQELASIYRGIQSKQLIAPRECKLGLIQEKDNFKRSRPSSTEIDEGKNGSSARLKKFVFNQSKLQKIVNVEQRLLPEGPTAGYFAARGTADENLHPIGLTSQTKMFSNSQRYLSSGITSGETKFTKFKKFGNPKIEPHQTSKESIVKSNSNRNKDLDQPEKQQSQIRGRFAGFSGGPSKTQSILHILEKIKNRNSQASAQQNHPPRFQQPQVFDVVAEEELIAEDEELEDRANVLNTILKPLTASTDFEENKLSQIMSQMDQLQTPAPVSLSESGSLLMQSFSFNAQELRKPHVIKNVGRVSNNSLQESMIQESIFSQQAAQAALLAMQTREEVILAQQTALEARESEIQEVLAAQIIAEQEAYIKDVVAQFNPEPYEGFDQESIDHMIESEESYRPDPYYLENHRDCEIRWEMRAILVDWLTEVAHEYNIKISTLQIAVNFLDRYSQAKGRKLKKNIYQLVGITCLVLASKMEEVFVAKLEQYCYATSNAFNNSQIRAMELEITSVKQLVIFSDSQALKFKLNPPTPFFWASWYTIQWDSYLESRLRENNLHLLLEKSTEIHVFFRKGNPSKSYKRYRELMQLLDITLLDVQTLQYKPRIIVASLMYIILGNGFRQFELEQIVETFPNSSLYLLDQNFAFNDFFAQFLVYHFGINLEDLLPTIQYTSSYFAVQFSYESPQFMEDESTGARRIGHLEDFLTFEVHNSSGLDFVLHNRPRNLL